MEIAKNIKRETLAYAMENYFDNTRIEHLVLEYLGNNSIMGKITCTRDICAYLEKQEIITSTGAVRGTILRIRHKLFKYRQDTPQHAYHVTFPEQNSKKGYMLCFKKNPHYRTAEGSYVDDPWLAMNWKALKKQGYRGMWHGLSLPDGGRGPLKLYVWINSVSSDSSAEEKFMCLINSPSSSKKHRIGTLSGEVSDNVLYMEGKWCLYTQEFGLQEFKMTTQMWPFRRNENDPVGIFGRFVLLNEENSQYQQGQIELSYTPLPLSNEQVEMMCASSHG